MSIGRSFRSHLADTIIHYTASYFTLFAVVAGHVSTTIGLKKIRHAKIRLKIGQNSASSSLADLAKLLPVQLINSDSYQLLNGGPKVRRQFLDRGVFHLEPSFFHVWQRFQRILKQRNAVLQSKELDQIKGWDYEIVTSAQELVQLRQGYLQQLTVVVSELVSRWLNLKNFSIVYYPGWDMSVDLKAILQRNLNRDLALGYTAYGPQRSDLLLKIRGIPISQALSRGEQKLLVCALQIAQGQLFQQLTGRNCIYIFDDLASEMDVSYQARVVDLLEKLQAQVFMTAIEYRSFLDINIVGDAKVFHVKSGQISVM